MDECGDGIVSSSIFAGFLCLSLHALGVGACIYRKGLFGESNEVKVVRKICNIPKSEMVILEIQIGNYEDGINVPVSRRKAYSDIMRIVK